LEDVALDQLCLTPLRAAEPDQHSPIQSCHLAAEEKLPRGVLVVDDDASILRLLDVALCERGFTVWKASNGKEGLSLYHLHRGDIALILLDVRMPVLDGPQSVAGLREVDPDVRFCFMSGHSGEYSHDHLLALGAACVFEKPFSLAEVLRTVEQLTRR
jgi:DNA-binding response OmpR family regulator